MNLEVDVIYQNLPSFIQTECWFQPSYGFPLENLISSKYCISFLLSSLKDFSAPFCSLVLVTVQWNETAITSLAMVMVPSARHVAKVAKNCSMAMGCIFSLGTGKL